MQTIVVLGAGKIGRMVAHFLGNCGDYQVRVGDLSEVAVRRVVDKIDHADGRALDFGAADQLDAILDGAAAVISCAPYHSNPLIAERAKARGVHYLDLTEDVAVTQRIIELAKGAKTALIPQCGLAPGFITICAVYLGNEMDELRDLRLRVGALPRYPSNMLRYNLTWSTEGLLNEYTRLCDVIIDGKQQKVQPMQSLERLVVDGVEYEAFNTSGGLGTLTQSLDGKVRNLSYKSIRYPGHNHLMRFLLQDLQMDQRQDVLRDIFDNNLPTTFQDQVVIFVSATGTFREKLTEATYARTVYHQAIDDENWSGIQITTAASVCAVLDLLMQGKIPDQGFVRQEQVDYGAFITNRFGQYYA